MRKLVNNNKHRIAATGVSLLLANFLVALLIDQFKLPIQPSVIVTGTLLISAITNKLISRYFR